jgi:hypothetical protein
MVMPIVITDFTNKTWAVEQPNDGYIHVGYSGEPGPRLLDILDFVSVRQKQFEKFVEKRQAQEEERGKRRRVPGIIVE